MFVLFSSNASILYLQDVLDALAYPFGHLIRFRYHKSYVDPSILAWKAQRDGSLKIPRAAQRNALIVYAEPEAGQERPDFSFYPLRYSELCSVRRIGSAIYVAMKLLGYPVYK